MSRKPEDETRNALLTAVGKLLVPVARILVSYGVPYKTFQEVAKRVYVNVAGDEFKIPGRKPSASRVAVLTGLPRKEVATLMNEPLTVEELPAAPVNPPARIIAAWRRDPDFLDSRGRPASLPFDGASPTFSELVKRYGNDVTPRAALDELVRVNAAERLRDGRIRLVARAYIPGETDLDTIGILGSHVPSLIASVEHNLRAEPGDSYFQRKVEYDNVPVEATARLRAEVTKHAQTVLEKLDGTLAKADRDANPKVKGTGRRRIALGIYYFEDDVPEE